MSIGNDPLPCNGEDVDKLWYDPPRIIELGDIAELTAFDVSVQVP